MASLISVLISALMPVLLLVLMLPHVTSEISAAELPAVSPGETALMELASDLIPRLPPGRSSDDLIANLLLEMAWRGRLDLVNLHLEGGMPGTSMGPLATALIASRLSPTDENLTRTLDAGGDYTTHPCRGLEAHFRASDGDITAWLNRALSLAGTSQPHLLRVLSTAIHVAPEHHASILTQVLPLLFPDTNTDPGDLAWDLAEVLGDLATKHADLTPLHLPASEADLTERAELLAIIIGTMYSYQQPAAASALQAQLGALLQRLDTEALGPDLTFMVYELAGPWLIPGEEWVLLEKLIGSHPDDWTDVYPSDHLAAALYARPRWLPQLNKARQLVDHLQALTHNDELEHGHMLLLARAGDGERLIPWLELQLETITPYSCLALCSEVIAEASVGQHTELIASLEPIIALAVERGSDPSHGSVSIMRNYLAAIAALNHAELPVAKLIDTVFDLLVFTPPEGQNAIIALETLLPLVLDDPARVDALLALRPRYDDLNTDLYLHRIGGLSLALRHHQTISRRLMDGLDRYSLPSIDWLDATPIELHDWLRSLPQIDPSSSAHIISAALRLGLSAHPDDAPLAPE